MKTVGCDLHAKQQSIALVDTETGDPGSRDAKAEAIGGMQSIFGVFPAAFRRIWQASRSVSASSKTVNRLFAFRA
jgi:hypothetical protein